MLKIVLLFYLTFLNYICIINIGNEKPQTWLPIKLLKNTSNQQVTDVFFIVYLLKITTCIITANTIIVSTTKPNKSMYIISNKTASIIAPPPFS